jgi:hypothetical protein
MKHNFWIYATTEEQSKTAASLIFFGTEVFKRAKCIREIDVLKNVLLRINSKSIHPKNAELEEFFFEYLIDCIRFLIFFENYMKAELIMKGYCIHLIDKNCPGFENLAKEQHSRPIKLDEIHVIKNFIINEEIKTIYHNAIKFNTIGIKELLESAYKSNYNFTPTLISIIQKLNSYRNTLHFFEIIEFQLTEELIANLEFMNNFVDDTIKRINNAPSIS